MKQSRHGEERDEGVGSYFGAYVSSSPGSESADTESGHSASRVRAGLNLGESEFEWN